uniref:AAA_12 domain-containing protein n=1 Tax=Caenorhabditis tropicalis TaxID=1561998 RepID=A0A1I7TXA5_9PELO
MEDVRIVFATFSSGFVPKVLSFSTFDPCMCVIDEASQVVANQTFPEDLKMKKMVVVGDPNQLPPLPPHAEAKEKCLNASILDQIMRKRDRFSCVTLGEQYRCHRDIIRWSNSCFYQNKLVNRTRDANTIRCALKPSPQRKFDKLYDPFVFIDTSLQKDVEKRTGTFEQIQYNTIGFAEEKNYTYINIAEADIAIEHYKNLRKMRIDPASIAILTPYTGQIDLLQTKIEELKDFKDCHLTKIGTVDSAQGQGYDVVIFSMVRSNPQS